MEKDRYTISENSSGFVLLDEVIPHAKLDPRYYSAYNFVGTRIDGYEEPVFLLTAEAAEALCRASSEFLRRGYGLWIYDAYRPQRAVDHFMRWAADPEDDRMKDIFYPDLEKDELIPGGYIAEHSGHSRGSTVDLTIYDISTGKELDMGGMFDLFGEISHIDHMGISDEQHENRMLLRSVMENSGFVPLAEEWWHFTLRDEPFPDTYFDFPVSREALAGREHRP